MRCRNCGYEAGYFNLRDGLCKSCRSTERRQYQSSTRNTADNAHGRNFACRQCGYEAGFLNLVDGLCKACRKKETEAENYTKENFRHKAEQEERNQSHRTHKKSSRKENGNRVFSCPSCKQRIRISLPIPSGVGRCVTCGARFSAYADHEGNLYIELMPEAESKSSESADDITSIDDCFLLLGLPLGATGSEIKSAYRKKMMEYHPDKVSSLGNKLKALAEYETKKLNYALTLLKANGYL
ncbi:MAG: J domain-containing protein [Pseudomonadaceae bacterium]